MKMDFLVIYFLKRKWLLSVLFIYFSFFYSAIVSGGFRKYQKINILVDRCLIDSRECNEALVRIHSYQVDAAIGKDFPCQTRLLGLESNLIMAMNNNFKRKKIYNMLKAVKKHC